MEADFTQLGRACSDVFGLWGSCRGLAVLAVVLQECSTPPRAGMASWAAENPRGSSPGQPNLEGLPENIGRFFMAKPSLFYLF